MCFFLMANTNSTVNFCISIVYAHFKRKHIGKDDRDTQLYFIRVFVHYNFISTNSIIIMDF